VGETVDQVRTLRESSLGWRLLLGLVIVVAIFVRFYGLDDRGIVLWDAAHYFEKSIQMMQELDHAVFRRGSLSILSGCELKPGHLLANAISFSVFGVRDTVVLGVQALCGVITVLVVYLIGSKMAGQQSGVLAAALFSVAGLAVGMSRTGWPQAISVLILGFGYLFYQSSLATSKKKWLFITLTGITGGMAAGLHLVILLFYFAVPVTEIWRVSVFRELSIRECMTRVGVFLPAVVGTAALFEFALNQMGSGYLGCTFGYILESQIFAHGRFSGDALSSLQKFFNFDYVIAALKFFWIALKEIETVFFAIGALISLGLLSFLALRQRNTMILIAGIHLLAGLFFALFGYATIKAIYHLYIPICLAGGIFYSRMLGLMSRSRLRAGVGASTTVFVIIVLASGLLASWPLISYRSGYDVAVRKVIGLVDQTGARFSLNEKHLGHSLSTIIPYYIYRKNGKRLDSVTSKNIGNFGSTDLVVVDFRAFKKDSSHEHISKVINEFQPVFQARNMTKPLPTVHFHRVGDLEKLGRAHNVPGFRNLMGFVSVYDLRKSRNDE